MSRDHRGALAERVEQPHHVSDQVQQGVLIDRFGLVGLSVASLVGRDRPVTGLRQSNELMTPRIPGLGKAVTENDQRPLPCFGHVHSQAIGLDEAMRDFQVEALTANS